MDTIERLLVRVRRGVPEVGPTGFAFESMPPTSPAVIREAERRLGFSLPPLLSAVYTRVANGGTGPGYGLIGVSGGFTDDLGGTVESVYERYREIDPEDPTWVWPHALLPICHWGCIIYSAVYCLAEGNPVVYVDSSAKQPGAAMASILIPHKPTLAAWFDDWLDGKDLWAEVWGRTA